MEPRERRQALRGGFRSTGSGMPESIACCHERRRNEDTAISPARASSSAASGARSSGEERARYGRT